MPIGMQIERGGKFLKVVLGGTAVKDDFKLLITEFMRLAAEHGGISVLLDMTRFQGWEADAFWPGIKFDLKLLGKLERLSVVGEARWQHAISAFTKPLTSAEVRFYDAADVTEAHAWLTDRQLVVRTRIAA